ncbi:Hypothetical predicted protein [Xyrichtys novacula]|uniref:Uncharacterized protein n=1 Tax=Xyrichtys novacula TaxID=13765 RepID=A0AAV1GAJ5_XYRNO|nr:Hypothetical predicted protein [Xyrichtys novacula]
MPCLEAVGDEEHLEAVRLCDLILTLQDPTGGAECETVVGFWLLKTREKVMNSYAGGHVDCEVEQEQPQGDGALHLPTDAAGGLPQSDGPPLHVLLL